MQGVDRWSKEQIMEVIEEALQSLVEEGKLVRTGTGQKGDPYKYKPPAKENPCTRLLHMLDADNNKK